MDSLVDRLQTVHSMVPSHEELFREAADAIETLQKERDELDELLECAHQNMKAMNANGDKLRAELATLREQIQDHEVDRILKMSPDEIRAEMIAEGLDPDEEVAKVKAAIRRAIDPPEDQG